MKIKFDIDATPQELRSFLGLPNIEPFQDEMIEIIRKNMKMGVEGFDPLTVMRPFFPEPTQQVVDALQKTFWQAMLGKTKSE